MTALLLALAVLTGGRALDAAPSPAALASSPIAGVRLDPQTRVGTVAQGVRGIATWYRYRPGEAAAGPRLRAMLGPSWRGTRVRVCTPSRCLSVVLTDFMRADRLVDLNRDDFQKLAPLSRGVLTVEVSW